MGIPSIKTAFEEQVALAEQVDILEDQMDELWKALARQLTARLPSGMKEWAEARAFTLNRSVGRREWQFPQWLMDLASITNDGDRVCEIYPSDIVRTFGFKNLDDAMEQFRALEQAWAGLVRIELERQRWIPLFRNPTLVVRYWAVELEPKDIVDEN